MMTLPQFAFARYKPEKQAGDRLSVPPAAATIFVVDDDEAVRRSLARLLRSAGWKVETLVSARDLLERAPLAGSGCILLDVQMPGMNGIELQECLSDAGISLPVVFLTGKGDIPMSVRAMKHGAEDFLVKPVEDAVLFSTLAQAILRHDTEMARRHRQDCILSRLALLTPRERQVLEQVLGGRLNKQIAFDLGIAEKTVKVHRGRVMEKMAAGSLAELVHICDSAGIAFPKAAEQFRSGAGVSPSRILSPAPPPAK